MHLDFKTNSNNYGHSSGTCCTCRCIRNIQTAQGQPLGQDIANQVLDSVFGTNDDDGGTEEEDGATETEEEEEAITGDDNQDIDQTTEQTNDQDQTANQPITQESSQDETNIVDNDLETGDNSAIVAQANDATQ